MTDREKLIELIGQVQYLGGLELALADHLLANGVRLESKQATSDESKRWIPVSERLPEPETEVLVLAERKLYSAKTQSQTIRHVITTGMYEDGTKTTDDSYWWWETDGFEYDEELDVYIIPEGWWEWKHYIDDECHNYAIDDFVTHWMPLPSPPEDEKK